MLPDELETDRVVVLPTQILAGVASAWPTAGGTVLRERLMELVIDQHPIGPPVTVQL